MNNNKSTITVTHNVVKFPIECVNCNGQPIFHYVMFHESEDDGVFGREFGLQVYCGSKGYFCAYIAVPDSFELDKGENVYCLRDLFPRDINYVKKSTPDGIEINGYTWFGWDYASFSCTDVTYDDVLDELSDAGLNIRKFVFNESE